jgi:hypothetical protein
MDNSYLMSGFLTQVGNVFIFVTVILINLLSTLLVKGETPLYNPRVIKENQEISATLSENDLPTGEGGFAKDYVIYLEQGDQVAIDLISDDFDSIVILIASDGSTIAENDDGPDGSTNSLLFSRITESDKYIVRVRAFGETGEGKFTLKVSRLKPVDN